MKARDAFEICLDVYKAARELVDERQPTSRLETSSKFIWRPDLRPHLVEFVADFALAGERALADKRRRKASRLILFRVHYLGGAEYEAARRLLGITEITWADWVDEIKERVGRELMRSGVFPPGRYFRVVSRIEKGKRRDFESEAIALDRVAGACDTRRMANPNGTKSGGEGASKVDPLANYILTESEREIAAPDKSTQEQLSLLLTEDAEKPAAKKSAGKKARPKQAAKKSPKKVKPRKAAAKKAAPRRGKAKKKK